jgi:hypothetical protein
MCASVAVPTLATAVMLSTRSINSSAIYLNRRCTFSTTKVNIVHQRIAFPMLMLLAYTLCCMYNRFREAACVGVLMNTRGLVELIILNAGLVRCAQFAIPQLSLFSNHTVTIGYYTLLLQQM